MKQSFGFFAPDQGVRNVPNLIRKSKWRIAFLTGVMLLLCVNSFAEPATLSGEEYLNLPAYDLQWDEVTPKSEVKIGDSIPLTIPNANLPKEIQVVPAPGMGELKDAGWGILPKEKGFLAIPLKPGAMNLPGLMIKDAQGKPIARTRSFSVNVLSSIEANDPKPKEPAPAEGPVSLGFPIWVVVLLGLLVLALLAGVGFAIYYYWKKRPKPIIPEVAKPLLPEDEEAFRALSQLEVEELIQKGQYKAYYFRISEIFKTYIGRRYRFDAPECTSREMIQTLENKNLLDDALLDEVEKNFELLDRVKFTDFIPHQVECVELLKWTRSFVTRTRKPKGDASPAQMSPPKTPSSADSSGTKRKEAF